MSETQSLKILILAGGCGKRLWPLAHAQSLKPHLQLHGDKTLLQATLERYRALSDDITIISHQNLPDQKCFVEPAIKGTAAALTFALKELKADDEDWILIAPSDHFIEDQNRLQQAILKSLAKAQTGHLVVFGVRPTHSHSGFGYLLSGDQGTSLIEKPLEKKAQELIAQGALWNMGLILAQKKTLLDELCVCAPVYSDWLKKGGDYTSLPNLSIDHALLEKSSRLAVQEVETRFTDLGSWDSVHRICDKSDQDNAFIGPVQSHNCTGTLIQAQKPVIAIGLKDLVVIETEKGILIADRTQSHLVKDFIS